MIDNQTTLLNKLIDKCTNPVELTSFYRLTNNPDDPGKLYEMLGLGKDYFTNIAIETLDISEGKEAFKAGWIDFKWKLSAFYAVQDVFDIPLYKLQDEKSRSSWRILYYTYVA